MKKRYTLLLSIAALCCYTHVHGQFATESKSGTSAILLNNSSISLSVADPKLSFDWTNQSTNTESENKDWFLTLGINAKNKSGVGNLFSKGNLVPESDLHGVLGFYYSNAIETKGERNEAAFNAAKENSKKRTLAAFQDIINSYEDSFSAEDLATLNEKLKANELSLRNYLINFETLYTALFSNSEKEKILKEIKEKMEKRKAVIDQEDDILGAKKNYTRRGQMSTGNYHRVSFFGFGNINASAFKRFNQLDTTDFSNSFEDIDFRGGLLGFGVNAEWKIFRLGLTYAYKATNNFSSLSASEYSLKAVNANSLQTLTQEDKLTAYTGKYGKVEINEFNVDLVLNLALTKDKSNYLLINPYLHSTLFSRDTSLLPNLTSVGAGFYFFKKTGSFIGGLYVELPDVDNTLEKRKPEEKQNLRPALKRLTFGITTKMSLQAIRFW